LDNEIQVHQSPQIPRGRTIECFVDAFCITTSPSDFINQAGAMKHEGLKAAVKAGHGKAGRKRSVPCNDPTRRDMPK